MLFWYVPSNAPCPPPPNPKLVPTPLVYDYQELIWVIRYGRYIPAFPRIGSL